MEQLHRTQIYIGHDQFRRLQIETRKEGVRGVSEMIRRAIDVFLSTRERGTDWKKDPLTKAVGKIRLTVNDAAEKHDAILYS